MPEDDRLRVLLVEDDPGDRWIISEILRSRGHVVTSCERAEAAWEHYRENPYPLALMDWMLPGTDGLELCRRIRSHPAGDRTVVLVVTSRDAPEDLEEVLSAGADDYVSKPIDVGLMNVRLAVAEKETVEASARKRTQDALQAKTEELEAFAYTVSHDLRSPLRTMEGFAHALLEDHGDELSEEAADYARRILASGRQAEALIRDLLDYSRLGLEEIELDDVELEEIVDAALERVEVEVRKADARIDVEGPLPPVRGHASTLVQVVGNLLSNAIKFVPENRTPRVRIGSEEAGARVRLWIEDNGIGVPPGQTERIFEVFERLPGGGSERGTGIGLAIVRRGMERIGGSAGMERDGDEGSRFWIEIPSEPPAAER